MSKPTQPVEVAWDELGDAFLHRQPGVTHSFDVQTGRTLIRVDGDDLDDGFDPWDPRYHQVPSIASGDAWPLMRDFAEAQSEALAERLLQTLEGKGAFRRFRNAVYQAGLHRTWSTYEHARACELAAAWLREQGIEATNPPPTPQPFDATDPRTEALETIGNQLNDAGATLLETAGGLREGSLDDCQEELTELRQLLTQLSKQVDELLG